MIAGERRVASELAQFPPLQSILYSDANLAVGYQLSNTRQSGLVFEGHNFQRPAWGWHPKQVPSVGNKRCKLTYLAFCIFGRVEASDEESPASVEPAVRN